MTMSSNKETHELTGKLAAIVDRSDELMQVAEVGLRPTVDQVRMLESLWEGLGDLDRVADKTGDPDDKRAVAILESRLPAILFAFCRLLKLEHRLHYEEGAELSPAAWGAIKGAAMIGDPPDWTDEFSPAWWREHVFRVDGRAPSSCNWRTFLENRKVRPGGTLKRVSFDRNTLTKGEQDRFDSAKAIEDKKRKAREDAKRA